MNRCLAVLGKAATSVVVLMALSACGGGGDSGMSPPPAPTAIPENLAITAPATAESATAVAFGNSTGALAGLKYQWDFGDGSTSTEAAPSHSFASGGDFEVVLKVTNEAGSSRETRTKLSVTNIANVRGLECSGPANTGWCWQNPKPTGNWIRTVFFVNASIGWRGGEGGDIFKTTDSGVTWVRQNAGTAASIYSIRFVNTTTGWASTESGDVLRTTDGGSTWAAAKVSDSYPGAITAVDAKTVYVGNLATGYSWDSDIRMHASKDGGVTWAPLDRLPTVITSTGTLWVLQDKTVSVSKDGGQTYTAVLTVDLPTGHNFRSPGLRVLDDQRAVAYAIAETFDRATQTWSYFQTLYTTTDGGANWSRADSPTAVTLAGIVSLSTDGKVLLTASGSRSTDGGRTWAIVPGPDAERSVFAVLPGGEILASNLNGLWMSKDDARSWTRLGNPTGEFGTASIVRRIAPNTLLADDSWSRFLSKDEGQSWYPAVQGYSNVSRAGSINTESTITFTDAKTGFMNDRRGGFFTTRDGGVNWVAKDLPLGAVRAVQFVSKQTGWLVSGDQRLYKSTDGGQNWAPVTTTPVPSVGRIHFENETLGWVGQLWGGDPSAFTRDGGKTWTALPDGLSSLRQGEQSWVAPSGWGSVSVSTDAGATWKRIDADPSASLYAVAFSDARTVWAVGTTSRTRTLLKSEDAGFSWTRVALPTATVVSNHETVLTDIKFVNAKVGWIVGYESEYFGNGGVYGLILATQDGGKTWHRQASGAGVQLDSIAVVDSNTAWITGDFDAILATGNGGK
jgi:photosystem II stability/assembly factor-like uncharacterized protein